MTVAEKKHLQSLTDLGCIACLLVGIRTPSVEIHHLRKGVGMGQRSNHYRAIPLCAPHHRTGGYGIALHAGQKAFERKYGTEEDLLEETMKRIKKGDQDE
jgi:hypothetical protein